ncbi:hypothetical protein CsatA_008907 [Cannabis sativa]
MRGSFSSLSRVPPTPTVLTLSHSFLNDSNASTQNAPRVTSTVIIAPVLSPAHDPKLGPKLLGLRPDTSGAHFLGLGLRCVQKMKKFRCGWLRLGFGEEEIPVDLGIGERCLFSDPYAETLDLMLKIVICIWKDQILGFCLGRSNWIFRDGEWVETGNYDEDLFGNYPHVIRSDSIDG